MRRLWLTAVCIALAALSLLVLPRPVAYDPWSWLIWGREIVHGNLDTRLAATAVKPLPIFIDTVLSLFGKSAAPVLWLLVARTATLLSLGLAFRLGHRFAGWVGGLVALVGLGLSDSYLGYLFMQGMSEPMATAAVLAAVDARLDGRQRAAFGWLVAAGLLRPEAWPFLVLYALWLLRERRTPRRVAALAVAVVTPAIWFLIDLVGAGQLFRSANAATHQSQGGPLLSREPGLATFRETWHLMSGLLVVLFLVAMAAEVWRCSRRHEVRPVLWLGIGALAWLVVDAVLAQGHFATGAPRYLLPGVGLAVVVIGQLAGDLVAAVASMNVRIPATAIGALTCLVLFLALIPRFDEVGHQVSTGVQSGKREARVVDALHSAIARSGGRSALLHCGPVKTQNFQVPLVAWTLDIPLQDVGLVPARPGTVLQYQRPRIPVGLRSAYHVVAISGRTDARWVILRTCS